jgi:hypothetical protein
MTQNQPTRRRTPAKEVPPPLVKPPRFDPQPQTRVRLKDNPDDVPGTVIVSDDWLDSLLLRGVDIADQTLVEWRRNGHPIYRWERTSQLEPVDTPKEVTADAAS